MDELASRLRNSSGSLMDDGMAALAIGGGLAEGQRLRDPAALFNMLSEKGACWEVVDLCRAAWRITRIESALLFPLIWDRWTKLANHVTVDDPLAPGALIGERSEYGVDQCTRSGIKVSWKLLRADPKLRAMLEDASILSATWHRTVGDLIFLVEGTASMHSPTTPLHKGRIIELARGVLDRERRRRSTGARDTHLSAIRRRRLHQRLHDTLYSPNTSSASSDVLRSRAFRGGSPGTLPAYERTYSQGASVPRVRCPW